MQRCIGSDLGVVQQRPNRYVLQGHLLFLHRYFVETMLDLIRRLQFGRSERFVVAVCEQSIDEFRFDPLPATVAVCPEDEEAACLNFRKKFPLGMRRWILMRSS